MLAEIKSLTDKNLISTIIIGWNVEAVNLFDRLLDYSVLGYNVRAFITPGQDEKVSNYKNVPVYPGLTNLSTEVERLEIKQVLIVLSPEERSSLSEILKICNRLGLDYRIVSDAYGPDYSHVIRDIIKEVMTPSEFGLRRVVDILGSLILLILLFPLFLIVAIGIKLESSGPIFYSQQRYGKNSKVFAVHKFRSMVQDAEKRSGPVWASKKDPRITRVGAFMRKTRIDELPQFMNVLKGDMSFIGPRPERPFFADTFKTKIPFYMNRLNVKPGITGLAQVTVGYDETLEDVKDKVRRDLEYIEHEDSLKMNLYIIWKTILVVLLGEGQ